MKLAIHAGSNFLLGIEITKKTMASSARTGISATATNRSALPSTITSKHGRCNGRTRRALGYPSQEVLSSWIDELEPGLQKTRTTAPLLTSDDKQAAVIALETRTASADIIAAEFGVTRAQLYDRRGKYLGGDQRPMKPNDKKPSDGEAEALLAQVADLRKEVDEQQLRKAILEETIVLLGKDQGTDPNRLTNKEKTLLIDSLRASWKLVKLLKVLGISRSSYHYQLKAIVRKDKCAQLRKKVCETFMANRGRYGRRRIHDELADSGTVAAERVISTIMREEGLVARGSKRKKRHYSSYKGELSEHPGNKVNRDFRFALPNFLWLTDVTQFSIPAGTVYLSPVIDCFDGMVVSHTLSTSPNAEMATTMLKEALSTLEPFEKPLIHTDCGCHYHWPKWIGLCEKAGLTRSMSKKGCSPDNSACEGFFGRLKNEMFYDCD
jgi:transposase InsO family protein/transposase-like protein